MLNYDGQELIVREGSVKSMNIAECKCMVLENNEFGWKWNVPLLCHFC